MEQTSKTKKLAPRTMPHSLEAEQSVLGCCLIDENALMHIMENLKVEDFYTQAHKTIFECMSVVYNKNQPVDFVTLSDELERREVLDSVGGIDYITTLTNIVPSAANAKHYATIVKRDSVLRKLIGASQKIIENAYNPEEKDVLSYAEKEIFDIAEKEDRSSLEQITNSLSAVLNKFEEIHRNQGVVRGISTGFEQLDLLTNGFQKSDLIILAARPAFGKSSLAMNFVNHAAVNLGKSCAVFSLEMSKEQIAQRTLCSIAGVSMQKALSGKLMAEDWKALWEGDKKVANAPIFIDDSSLNSPTDVLNKCRRLKREKGLDLVMIDYLQLMTSGSKKESRQQEVSDLTRNLKIAARELQVPIILLSQLSRDVEKRDDHTPKVSDLRESGSIEQDADIVMFINNPSYYTDTPTEDGPNVREIIVAKHRNGPLGTVKVKWISEITTFVDMPTSAEVKSLENTAPPDKRPNFDADDLDY